MKHIVILGAGPAGIEAAKNLHRLGHQVSLIEKSAQLGGHLAQWDRLFPDKEDAQAVLNELLDQFPKTIQWIPNTQLQHIEMDQLPYTVILSQNQQLKADALLICTGFETFEARRKEEYGYGIYDNVISSADLERLFRQDRVVCKDGREPQTIAMVHCVGSRDEKVGNRYCSKLCCVTAVKQACELKERFPNAQVYNLYMDLRMFDRQFEALYHEAQFRYGINFIRGRLSEASEMIDGRISLKAEDTLLGKPLKLSVDLLVLMVGMEATPEMPSLAAKLGLFCGDDRFLNSAKPYTHNNLSRHPGIFMAGTCTGPKSLPDTLADARAASLEIHHYLTA